jgi:hypothetical protein
VQKREGERYNAENKKYLDIFSMLDEYMYDRGHKGVGFTKENNTSSRLFQFKNMIGAGFPF